MVSVRVRCWVVHYTYESPHKDISTGCVCVSVSVQEINGSFLSDWHIHLFQTFMDIISCVYNQNPHSSNQLSVILSLPFLSPVPADAAFLLIYLKFILFICTSSHPKKRKPEKNYNRYDNREPNATAFTLLLLRSDTFCQPWKPVYQLRGKSSQLQFNDQLLLLCRCLFSSLISTSEAVLISHIYVLDWVYFTFIHQCLSKYAMLKTEEET